MKLQTNNIEAISGPNQFSPARFIQFRYFEKYYVVSHSAVHHILVRRSGIFWIEELLEAWQKLYIRH